MYSKDKAFNEELESLKKTVEGYEDSAASWAELTNLSSKVTSVFTYLSDVSCGIMTGEDGEYILLCAASEKKLTTDELETIENYLLTQTGLAHARLDITQPKK